MFRTIQELCREMARFGASHFYAKLLAPNDNSKNQIYLGGDYSSLNIIPFQNIAIDGSFMAGSKRERAKAKLDFYWLVDGGLSVAPNAQLILYPRYPEVRLSGILQGATKAPGSLIRSREPNRCLFLGITNDGRIIAFATSDTDQLSRELTFHAEWTQTGVFVTIPQPESSGRDSTQDLLVALGLIHRKGWIESKKLTLNGPVPYTARNGGGYTLEAELGIIPNGVADVDFQGWEVKQFGVNNFVSFKAKSPVTLMTPEPDLGIYNELGIESFVRSFGYPDKSGVPDRLNFGGRHAVNGTPNSTTQLSLTLEGYTPVLPDQIDLRGSIQMVDASGRIAAGWSFPKLLQHWNRKHAKAVYVPSITKLAPVSYMYGSSVDIGIGTSFDLFLLAVAMGKIFYDPGIKLERASSSNPDSKRRSQFRINHSELASLYSIYETRSVI